MTEREITGENELLPLQTGHGEPTARVVIGPYAPLNEQPQWVIESIAGTKKPATYRSFGELRRELYGEELDD